MPRHDTKIPPRRPIRVAWIVALALAACAEPVLELALRTPDGSPVPAAVERLSVRVLSGQELLGKRDQAYDGGPVELPEVEWRRDLWFYVAGLDASGVLQATAEAHPALPSEPRRCCIVACLCTAAQRANDECTCGTNTCASSCEP